MAIRVTIVSLGNVRPPMELDETVPVEDLITLIVAPDSHADWHLYYKGHLLGPDETLESAGVQQSETLILVAPIRGRSIPDALLIAEAIATIATVFLSIADMWSRRAKENKSRSQSKSMRQRNSALPWDEVKRIEVEMSDGSPVMFDALLSDPKRVRSFIDVFNNPSASVVPKEVVFWLKSGSPLKVNLSDPGSLQELDKLLEFLMQ